MSARERWISLTTSHFELYTDSTEKQALDALQSFEQVRYFFLQNSAAHQAPEGRVRIIAFSSEKEFKPYRINAGAFAYYQQSHERDYIVMQDIEPEHHKAAIHEYTHLIVQHLKLNLPIWLNEGMADLYSSLEPEGNKALVGRPLAAYGVVLNGRPWMDWNVLFAVDHNSPYYNIPDKMAIFYAQSWALTHMLELGPAYSAGYSKFLARVANGTPTPDALQSIYGKSVAQVGEDVRRYVHQSSVRGAVYNVALPKADLDPAISPLLPFDLELALADLLSTRPQTAGQAQERLQVLEQQNPKNLDVEVSMGYLAWQQNKLEDARRHFGLAVEHGLKNPKLIYQYAQLLQPTNPPPDKLETLLSEAIELQPDNLDARLFLAGTALTAHQYAKAYQTLLPVHTVPPDEACRFFTMSAFARTNLKEYAGARESAQKALSYAKTPEERSQIERLLTFLDREDDAAPASSSVATPTSDDKSLDSANGAVPHPHAQLTKVQGITKAFDCLPGGPYRLHVQVGAREMVFAMPRDPRDVVVKDGTNVMTMFSCGPLKPKNVTVSYASPADGSEDGTIAELAF